MARDPEAAMNLAIFFDAVAVAGRAELLARASDGADRDCCAARARSWRGSPT